MEHPRCHIKMGQLCLNRRGKDLFFLSWGNPLQQQKYLIKKAASRTGWGQCECWEELEGWSSITTQSFAALWLQESCWEGLVAVTQRFFPIYFHSNFTEKLSHCWWSQRTRKCIFSWLPGLGSRFGCKFRGPGFWGLAVLRFRTVIYLGHLFLQRSLRKQSPDLLKGLIHVVLDFKQTGREQGCSGCCCRFSGELGY